MVAKRLSERTVPTDSVQGEGSFVRICPLTIGEILDMRRQREVRASPWFKLGRIVGWIRRLFRPYSQTDETERIMFYTFAKVSAWNWVNASGQPLPQPKDEPNIVFQLTDDEYTVIHNAALGFSQSEEQKN